jgi:glycosidase
MKKFIFLLSAIIIFWSLDSCSSIERSDIKNHAVVQYGVPFDGVPDPRDVTIYQVNIRSFSEEGNILGVTKRIDSIKSLGANVIYLMPIYPVGELRSINSPYCIKDYSVVSQEFGSLADLRMFVEEAHKRGIAVILDWVANHTAFDHVWTEKNKHWYMQDSTGNIINPPGHNWRDVAQLDFSNQDMRLEMIKTMKNWVLTANIDGFRCDYSDGPPYDFWKQAIDTLRNISGHKLLLMSEGRRRDHYEAGFDYNFGFVFFNNLKRIFERDRSVKTIEDLNISDYEGAKEEQQIIRYTSNHDVNSSDGTPLDLFGGEKGSIAAFIITAYMKSVPMIYNGQEVGLPYKLTFPFTSTTIDWSVNPEITKEYKKIISFRNESMAIKRGSLSSFSSDDICAFIKKHEDEEVLILVNLRNKNIDFKFDNKLSSSAWYNVMNGKNVELTEKVSMEPFQYLILRKSL